MLRLHPAVQPTSSISPPPGRRRPSAPAQSPSPRSPRAARSPATVPSLSRPASRAAAVAGVNSSPATRTARADSLDKIGIKSGYLVIFLVALTPTD